MPKEPETDQMKKCGAGLMERGMDPANDIKDKCNGLMNPISGND